MIIIAVGIIGVKDMLGDEVAEIPFEEQAEKTFNLQEDGESSEIGESEDDESQESSP